MLTRLSLSLKGQEEKVSGQSRLPFVATVAHNYGGVTRRSLEDLGILCQEPLATRAIHTTRRSVHGNPKVASCGRSNDISLEL